MMCQYYLKHLNDTSNIGDGFSNDPDNDLVYNNNFNDLDNKDYNDLTEDVMVISDKDDINQAQSVLNQVDNNSHINLQLQDTSGAKGLLVIQPPSNQQ